MSNAASLKLVILLLFSACMFPTASPDDGLENFLQSNRGYKEDCDVSKLNRADEGWK